VRLAVEAARVPSSPIASAACSGYRSWHASLSGNARPLTTREKHRRHIGWAISFEELRRDASAMRSSITMVIIGHRAFRASRLIAVRVSLRGAARARELATSRSVTRIATRSG